MSVFWVWINSFQIRVVALITLFSLGSCSPRDPEGKYHGEVKDWVHEVFEGYFVENAKEWAFELTLNQGHDLMRAEVILQAEDGSTINRVGKWRMGDGERVIEFNDGNLPREYFLIKRGVRYAYQTKEGLFNDDGSPLLLVRNEGRSIKGSYPFEIIFGENGGFWYPGAETKEYDQVLGSMLVKEFWFQSSCQRLRMRRER